MSATSLDDIGPPASWFDLITVDVVDPRAAARFWCDLLGLVVQQDEDDGRWVVVAEPGGSRLLGFQRSSETEVAAREHSRGAIELQTPNAGACGALAKALGARVRHGRVSMASIAPFMIVEAPETSVVAVFEVDQPTTIARFWADAAGLFVTASNPVRVDLGLIDAPFVAFRTRDKPAPRSLVHLDLECAASDFDAEVLRLVSHGAVRVGSPRDEHYGTSQILLDPSGSLFCHNAYEPSVGQEQSVTTPRGRRRLSPPNQATPVNLSPRR